MCIRDSDSSFPMVVHDFVAMGLWREIGAFGGVDRARHRRIAAAIDLVGLNGLESRPIGALSGGQLQRAHFARVLLQDAPLVLLDEPYGCLLYTSRFACCSISSHCRQPRAHA